MKKRGHSGYLRSCRLHIIHGLCAIWLSSIQCIAVELAIAMVVDAAIN